MCIRSHILGDLLILIFDLTYQKEMELSAYMDREEAVGLGSVTGLLKKERKTPSQDFLG